MNKQEQKEWIINWLQTNLEASSMNTQFHEDFHAKFGGARKERIWGAQPVRSAMSLLSEMAKDGILEVRRVGLQNWQPGFPKHCLCYSLPNTH